MPILHALDSKEKAELEAKNDRNAGWSHVVVQLDPKTKEWLVIGSMKVPRERKKIEVKEEPTDDDIKALEENPNDLIPN